MRVDQSNLAASPVVPRPRAASEPGSGAPRLASEITGAANAEAGMTPRPLTRSKSVGSLPSLGDNVVNVSSQGAAATPLHAEDTDRAVESRPLHHPVEVQGLAHDRVRGDLPEALRAKLDQHYTDSSFSTWHLDNLAHVLAVLGRPGAGSEEGRTDAYDACLKRFAEFLEKVPPYSIERDGFMKQLEALANFVVNKVGDAGQLVASYRDNEARERMSPAVRQAVDKRIGAVIEIGKRVTLGSSKLDTLSSALYMCSASPDTFKKLAEKRSGDARIHVPNDDRDDRSRRAEGTPHSTPGHSRTPGLDDSKLPESHADFKMRHPYSDEQEGPYAAYNRSRRRSI